MTSRKRKATLAGTAAYLASTGILGALAAVQDNARLLDPLPDSVTPFVLALVPTAVAAVTAWRTKHAPPADGTSRQGG